MVGGLRVLEEMKQDKLETHSKQRTRISLAAAACCVLSLAGCSLLGRGVLVLGCNLLTLAAACWLLAGVCGWRSMVIHDR